MSFTHDRIICPLLCDCLFSPLFSSFLLGVYKQYTHLRCIAIAWNFTGIWYMAHGCLDIGHLNKYTSGISYILMEIPTYSYHVDGTQRYKVLLYFNTVWLRPDVYPFSLHLFLVHSVHRMSTFSHGFSCIRNVYLCYTTLYKQVHSVYNMYTSGFTFLGWLYDH